MGRRPVNTPCRIKGCPSKSRARGQCQTHYKQWQRRYGHLRCDTEGCRRHQHDGVTGPKMHPRRTPYGRRGLLLDHQRVWLCQEHERILLALTPEVERLNLDRLAHGIAPGPDGPDGLCWIYQDTRGSADRYQPFTPEGANKADWLAHRVSYDLLVGGHRHARQLDHLCRRSDCINPMHLEPVTATENARRRGSGPQPYRPEIAKLPAVLAFALDHHLPHPMAHQGRWTQAA